MEFIIIPKNIDMIKKLKQEIDGVILGLKNFAVSYEKEYTVEEIGFIKSILKDKKVFVSINKNILNHEVEACYNQIKELNKISISGILFYDLSILNYKKEINHDLWWAQEHFTTNYLTVNYYEKEGIKGTYISSDITKKDMEEIRENTKMELMINGFGYLPIFISRRHIVENYKKNFKIDSKEKDYFIEKEDKRYPIVDKKKGTCVYSSFILNAAAEVPSFRKENFQYMVLNSFHIEEDTFQKIVHLFLNIKEDNKEEIQKEIDKLCKKNTDKAFLYTNTIFKVK